jgi:hypothetical protein
MGKSIIVVCLIIIMSYHFSDINSQFKVMSGNIKSEGVL